MASAGFGLRECYGTSHTYLPSQISIRSFCRSHFLIFCSGGLPRSPPCGLRGDFIANPDKPPSIPEMRPSIVGMKARPKSQFHTIPQIEDRLAL